MAIDIPEIDYTTPPTAESVEAKIKGANWWPSDPDQIEVARYVATLAIQGSLQRFLRIVRWEPFISSGEDEARYYNKITPDGKINLGEGLLSLTSLTVLNRVYTLNETVYLEPSNAQSKNKPYTSLHLWSDNFGSAYGDDYEYNYGYASGNWRELRPRSIVVTGKWGYTLEWPADAYDAIIARAAAITLSSVNQESELSGISQDGYSEQYDLVGPIDQKKALEEWGKYFDAIAASYTKPTSGPRTLNTSPNAARNMRRYLPAL